MLDQLNQHRSQSLIMPESPVTIRQIAENLGISKSTVSLALQGKGRVAEATRQRVRDAAEKMGYRPDPLLSAFSRRRGKNVSPGSVIAFVRRESVQRPIHEDLIGMAEKLGYRFERFALNQHPSQAALARILRARGIAGVFFAEIPQPIELEPSVWDAFPGIYCGPYPTGDETCSLDIIQHNPFDTVLLAWEKAHQAGCSRIALLLPTQTSAPSNLELQTLAAYRLLQEQSARNDPKLKPLVTHFEHLRSDPEILKNWFARTQPDVILGGFQALYFFLRDHLEDFSDCCPFIALRAMGNDDEVAGYTLEREVVAEIALRRLHALIQDPMPAMSRSVSLVVNPTWKPGKSFQPTS